MEIRQKRKKEAWPCRNSKSSFPLSAPYSKILPSRMTDNMETLLSSGVPAVRTLEITADVVGNRVYKNILLTAANEVKGGSSISEALFQTSGNSLMVVQMVRTGEETGKLNFMLKTLGRFYKKEGWTMRWKRW